MMNRDRQASLHPVLQAALESLDVCLEDEVARLRQNLNSQPKTAPLPQPQGESAPREWSPPTGDKPAPPPVMALTRQESQPLSSTSDPLPEDYLASSEALLRTLEGMSVPEPEAMAAPQEERQGPRVTWLGIAAGMVALGAIAFMVISVLSEQRESPPAETDQDTPSSSQPEPSVPDLATGEGELDELALEALADLNLAPPMPVPDADPPQGASQQGDYYVVVKYRGDDQLAAIRTLEPEARLRYFPIGVRVQVGAFQQLGEARSVRDRLREQEIEAEIYPF